MNLLQAYAMQFVGKPYKWGGDDPMAGLDCSGLVLELLAAIGIKFGKDMTSHEIYLHCITSNYPKQRECGSLAFYGKDGKISHVAMFLNQYLVIEAGSGSSKTNTLQDAIDMNAFVRLRPFGHRKDFVGFYKPPVLEALIFP